MIKALQAGLLLLTTTGICLSAPAQVGGKPHAEAKKKIEAKVRKLRKQMREGTIQRYNVFVKVWLKNGNRFKGVVKNGRFVELSDGLDFVRGDRKNPKAGLRLWYAFGTDSFIFIPHASIKTYKIGARMSDREVRALADQLNAIGKESEAARQQQLAKQKAAAEKAAKEKAARQGAGPTEPKPSLSAAQKKLLADFPPDDGWSKERLDQIKRNKIVIGRYPDKQEAAFEKNFAAWAKAKELADKIAATEKGGGKQTGTPAKPGPGGAGGSQPTGTTVPGGAPQTPGK